MSQCPVGMLFFDWVDDILASIEYKNWKTHVGILGEETPITGKFICYLQVMVHIGTSMLWLN